MKDDRSSAMWVAATVLLVTAMVSAYVTAYFLRSDYASDDYRAVRLYYTELEPTLFQPAARVEAAITGKEVLCLRGAVLIE